MHVGKNMIPVVILILICILVIEALYKRPFRQICPFGVGSFLNLGQTVEKHEEEHILTVEDHQEEKQRAMRQKRVQEHIGCPMHLVINLVIHILRDALKNFEKIR